MLSNLCRQVCSARLMPQALFNSRNAAINTRRFESSTSNPPRSPSDEDQPYYSVPAGEEKWHGKDALKFRFPQYNLRIHPPIQEEIPKDMSVSEYRPAYICHMRDNVKYSYKRMFLIASLVRGLTIDEAIKQLSFVNNYGAIVVKETLMEAQEMAVNSHNVEFRSNLWVAESFVGKAPPIKGMRRHARGQMATINYSYVNYFVKLEEGKPPEHYYDYKRKLTSEEMLQNFVKTRRSQIVPFE